MHAISTFKSTPGAINTVKSQSSSAVFYRVEFEGAGSVRFIVQPGGEFEFVGDGSIINIYIEDQLAPGLAPVDK